MADTTCGDFGGTTDDGEPCGRHVAEGRCWDHRDDDSGGLSPAYQKFVQEYCKDFNATRAAKSAGYSENTAGQKGYQLLKIVEVSRAIANRLDEHGMSAAEATERMADMARANLRAFTRVDEDGHRVIDLSTPEAESMLHVVRKMKSTTKELGDGDVIERKVEIELHDAKDALHKILKAHGAYTEQVDITSNGEPLAPIILPSNGHEPDLEGDSEDDA